MMNHTNELDKLNSDCGKTPRAEESLPVPEKPSSDYYYDDSTGYEVYDDSEDENDEESRQPAIP